MIEAIRLALTEEMEADDRVMVLGEDVGAVGGVFRATDGLQARFGAERVVDTPLAEAAIIGTSIGLAAAGLVPVPEIQFLGFAHQAYHQVGPQMARLHYRSQGRFNAQITMRAPFGGNVDAPELHSDAYESLYTSIPGLKVVAPGTARDARALLRASIQDPDPVIFLEPLRGYRLVKDDVPEQGEVGELGTAAVRRAGGDITILCWSSMVVLALQVAEACASDGIDIEVVDLRTLAPLDTDTIVASATKTGRVIVLEEAPRTSGFGAELAARVQEEAFLYMEAPVMRVSGLDVPYPVPSMEKHYIPNAERLRRAIDRSLHY